MRQRWLIIAATLAIPALIFFGRQFYLERTRLAQQLAAWEQEQAFEGRLDQLVDIPAGEGMPWRVYAAEFTRQTGLEVTFRDEQYFDALYVFHEAKRQPARLALDPVCERIHGNWFPDSRGGICVSSRHAGVGPPTEVRPYALDPGLSPADKRQMEELLREMLPFAWSGSGGNGELIDVPGAQFVIAQDYHDQARLEQILPRLQKCLRDADSLPALGLDPADPRLAPIVLDAPSQRRVKAPLNVFQELWGAKPRELKGPSPGTVAFPIPDFSEQQDQERLKQLLQDSIRSDSWGRYAGVDSLHLQGKLLIISLENDALPKIEGLLRAVRTVRGGHQRWASAELSSAEGVSGAREDALRPKALKTQTQVLDARALLASRRCTSQELKDVLIASVNHDYWTDQGEVVSIVESQGLLVVHQWVELLVPIRHILAAIERHYFTAPAQRERGNLAAKLPDQSNSKSPQIYVYAVEDLLEEKDSLLIHHFKYDLQTTTLKRAKREDDLPIVVIHGKRFLIAHLHEDQVAPLEAKLRSMREPAATE